MYKKSFFGVVALLFIATLFAFRSFEVRSNLISDFDTNLVLKVLSGEEPKGPSLLFGVAHPGMLMVVTQGLRLFVESGMSPRIAWSAALISALAATCALAFVIASNVGCIRSRGFFAVALILTSPITQDIAKRSEENLITQTVFIACIAVLAYELKRSNGARSLVLAVASVALAAQHLQAATVFISASLLYLFLGSHEGVNPLQLRSAIKLAFSLILPPLAFGALVNSLGIADLAKQQRGYAESFHSIMNNDGLFDYLSSYLMFFKGYLLNGHFDFIWINGQSHPRSHSQFCAAALLITVLIMCRRGNLLDCLCLAGLALPLLYEPSSSERWDTFLIPFALRLASKPKDEDSFFGGTQTAIGAGILLTNLLSSRP